MPRPPRPTARSRRQPPRSRSEIAKATTSKAPAQHQRATTLMVQDDLDPDTPLPSFLATSKLQPDNSDDDDLDVDGFMQSMESDEPDADPDADPDTAAFDPDPDQDDPDPELDTDLPAATTGTTTPALVQLRPGTVGDVDNLWDWIRKDADRGYQFLGRDIRSSLDLHIQFQELDEAERRTQALVLAITDADTHIGFLIVNPLNLDTQIGVLHLYLCPDQRGRLRAIVPSLLAVADVAYPTLQLVIQATDGEAARLYRPFGFVTHYTLIRPPSQRPVPVPEKE